MGMVYRQKGRTIWMLKYYRDGHPIVESSGTDDKTQAKKLLRNRETDIDRGLPLSSQVGQLRFEEAARDIETDYVTNGRRSLGHVQRRIRLHLSPVFGGQRLSKITTADVRSFVQRRLEAGAAPAEINRELAVLKRMFTIAVQGAKLLHRPHIPMLKEDNVRTGFFEPEQYAAVYARLPDYLQPAIQFAYLTGWRVRSEILPIEWRQVNFDGGTVRLFPRSRGQRRKTDDGRVFPFDVLPDLLALLEQQARRRIQLCPYVFHRDGKPIRDFREAWSTACEGAGWPTLIPHDFRRTAVRNLVRAGVPEKTAMLLTGHKTRSVFDRYDIVNEADLREAVSRLAAARTPKLTASHGRVLRTK
jgi:integrase